MTIVQIISLIAVLVLSVVAGIFIVKKSEKNSLTKWIGLIFLVGFAFTWIFVSGQFSGTTFNEYGMVQQGLTDIPNYLYYALNFAGDKIVFLLALGAFYAVLTKCKGYKKLVLSIAKKFKGKEIVFSVIVSLLLTVMTSLLNQALVVLIFVPFLVSILLNMKLDKLSAFAITFGSILIGTLGITYGGDGSYWFNYYTGTTVGTALLYRVLVLVVSFILFNVLSILHIKKVLKENVNEIEDDPFKVEKSDDKSAAWPYVIVLILTLIITILGYFSWETFEITVFSKFHEWLMELSIGDFAIFKVILGTLATDASKGSFGNWSLFLGATFLAFMSVLIALLGRVKFDDFISSYKEGFAKMLKPVAVYIGIYMVLIVVYMAPVIPTIANLMFKNITSFNPFLTVLMAVISNVFYTDFGLTGFAVAAYFTETYANNVDVIHTIFTTMYGWVGFVAPTSAILAIGLSYLNIDYKDWIKYIWIFVVTMLVLLLILFVIMTYI